MKRYWQKQYRRTKYRGVAADLPAHESRAWLTDCNFNAMRKSILTVSYTHLTLPTILRV